MFSILIYANSIFFLGIGLLSPFLTLYIQSITGIEFFGLAIGLMIISAALSSFFSGILSDTIGRKKIIIFASFTISILILLYTVVENIWQLCLLQIIYGIITGAHYTAGTSLLGDLTKEFNRGSKIGLYDAITGVITGFAAMFGGFITSQFGSKTLFIIVSILIFISSLLLIRLPKLHLDSNEPI